MTFLMKELQFCNPSAPVDMKTDSGDASSA